MAMDSIVRRIGPGLIRATTLVLLVSAISTAAAQQSNTSPIRRFIERNGGCEYIRWRALDTQFDWSGASSPLGKPALSWTDQDFAEYTRFYRACLSTWGQNPRQVESHMRGLTQDIGRIKSRLARLRAERDGRELEASERAERQRQAYIRLAKVEGWVVEARQALAQSETTEAYLARLRAIGARGRALDDLLTEVRGIVDTRKWRDAYREASRDLSRATETVEAALRRQSAENERDRRCADFMTMASIRVPAEVIDLPVHGFGETTFRKLLCLSNNKQVAEGVATRRSGSSYEVRVDTRQCGEWRFSVLWTENGRVINVQSKPAAYAVRKIALVHVRTPKGEDIEVEPNHPLVSQLLVPFLTGC